MSTDTLEQTFNLILQCYYGSMNKLERLIFLNATFWMRWLWCERVSVTQIGGATCNEFMKCFPFNSQITNLLYSHYIFCWQKMGNPNTNLIFWLGILIETTSSPGTRWYKTNRNWIRLFTWPTNELFLIHYALRSHQPTSKQPNRRTCSFSCITRTSIDKVNNRRRLFLFVFICLPITHRNLSSIHSETGNLCSNYSAGDSRYSIFIHLSSSCVDITHTFFVQRARSSASQLK